MPTPWVFAVFAAAVATVSPALLRAQSNCWECRCNQTGCGCLSNYAGYMTCTTYGLGGCDTDFKCPPEKLPDAEELAAGFYTTPDGTLGSSRAPIAVRLPLSEARTTPAGTRLITSCGRGVVFLRVVDSAAARRLVVLTDAIAL